jgi:hypothetical protein
MVDDDTTRRRSRYLGPFDAFHRALGSTMVAFDQLGASIRCRDVAGAERAASDAVESWLTMRRAVRKLELDAVDNGQRLQAARSATRANRRALGDLLDRAQAQLGVASLHQLLAQLRLSLAIANDECGGRPNNDREKDPSSEA